MSTRVWWCKSRLGDEDLATPERDARTVASHGSRSTSSSSASLGDLTADSFLGLNGG